MSKKKQSPYVNSGYPRIPHDHYPTVDPRCIDGLLQFCVLGKDDIVDPCSPQGSRIVDELVSRGYKARGVGDAFAPIENLDWIVSNPPYTRGLVDKIINHQIQRIPDCKVSGLRCYSEQTLILRRVASLCFLKTPGTSAG